MARFLIDFEWLRDPRGYRLVEKKRLRDFDYHPPRPRRELSKLPGQWGLVYLPFGIRVLCSPPYVPRFVVGNSERSHWQPYRPLDRFESLYAQFAEVKTAEQVLGFIEKFGPLTKDGLDSSKGELIDGVIIHAEAIREILRYRSRAGGDRRSLAEFLDPRSQLNPFADLEVSLDFDPADSSPRLRFLPSSLLDALWLQVVQELAGGATVRQCRHCGQWFETGAGTGRRLDAKFCCDQHRVSFNSLKRSKEG